MGRGDLEELVVRNSWIAVLSGARSCCRVDSKAKPGTIPEKHGIVIWGNTTSQRLANFRGEIVRQITPAPSCWPPGKSQAKRSIHQQIADGFQTSGRSANRHDRDCRLHLGDGTHGPDFFFLVVVHLPGACGITGLQKISRADDRVTGPSILAQAGES